MRRILPIFALLLAGLLSAAAPTGERAQPAATASISFRSLDVLVDAHGQALAAYQLELVVKKGDAAIVGIEGGAAAAFREPPYYDPAALRNHRIIIAAFSTADAKELPHGKTRVARFHLQVTGDEKPEYAIKLDTAATADGTAIAADASIAEGEPR